MSDNLSVDTVIGEIYEASYKPDHWPIALEKIAQFTHSNSAAFLNHDNELQQASGIQTYNIPHEVILEYNTLGHDPNFGIFAENIPIGVAAAVDHVIPDRKRLEEIYGDKFTEFTIKTDLYHVAGSVIFMDDTRSTGLALQRQRTMGAWDKPEIEKLNLLIPHIQRAINIQREFIRLQTREQALQKGLDKLLIGLILFNNELQPIYINPVAESILNYHPAIELRNNKIYAHKTSDTNQIHLALVSAITSINTLNDSSTTALGLTHPDSETVLPVIITPTHNIKHDFDTKGKYAFAAMSFSDPNKSYPIDTDKLMKIYGLTQTESQVAVAIANGASADAIASMHNVATSTIRSQIKTIYQKVGINSQIELIKIILTGPFIQSI